MHFLLLSTQWLGHLLAECRIYTILYCNFKLCVSFYCPHSGLGTSWPSVELPLSCTVILSCAFPSIVHTVAWAPAGRTTPSVEDVLKEREKEIEQDRRQEESLRHGPAKWSPMGDGGRSEFRPVRLDTGIEGSPARGRNSSSNVSNNNNKSYLFTINLL